MQAYVVLSLRPLDHSLEPSRIYPETQCILVHPGASRIAASPHRPGNYNRGAPLVPHKGGAGKDVITISSGQEQRWSLGTS